MKRSHILHHLGPLHRISSHSLGEIIYIQTAFNSPFSKFEYVKVPFGLAQAPAYFQELMTGILKDFPFAIAYLYNIIIFSKTPQEHLTHICMVFENLKSANLLMKKASAGSS